MLIVTLREYMFNNPIDTGVLVLILILTFSLKLNSLLIFFLSNKITKKGNKFENENWCCVIQTLETIRIRKEELALQTMLTFTLKVTFEDEKPLKDFD